jgi:hypothetical protein
MFDTCNEAGRKLVDEVVHCKQFPKPCQMTLGCGGHLQERRTAKKLMRGHRKAPLRVPASFSAKMKLS